MSVLELAVYGMRMTGNRGVKYLFLMLQLQFLLRCKLNLIKSGFWISYAFKNTFKQLEKGAFCSSSFCSSPLLTQIVVIFKLF